ncbi:MAG: hypothetical protein KDA22_06565 [Phycisphaerales bacterium]|nr:hypothetical protein [Phycisphaerales bacterium]
MPMTSDQLRTALRELNGQRDLRMEFEHASSCIVKKALLIPAESDGIVKVTDGSHVYLVDAERVAWVEIG